MSVNVNELLGSKALASMDPEKRRQLTEFARNVEGKNMVEIAAMYRKLPAFTEEERRVVIGAISEKLSEADKQKFSQILKMLKV